MLETLTSMTIGAFASFHRHIAIHRNLKLCAYHQSIVMRRKASGNELRKVSTCQDRGLVGVPCIC